MVQTNRILKPVIAIAGPTAIGKSALAVRVAQALGGEVISADSMQVYREIAIGTAKPTQEEMQGIPHHLIDIVSCLDPFSASEFAAMARECIADVGGRGAVPVVVGGSGMYLRGLLDGYSFSSFKGDEAFRARMHGIAEREGNEALHRMLAERNPERAAQIHVNDTKRIVRALELCEFGDGEIPVQVGIEHTLYVLNAPRELVYERIDRRVEQMVRMGLADEVRGLASLGITRDLQAMQAIGYKEVFPYLDGRTDSESMIASIQQNTRRFAKRQLTYFRSMPNAKWIDSTLGIDTMCDIIVENYRNSERC